MKTSCFLLSTPLSLPLLLPFPSVLPPSVHFPSSFPLRPSLHPSLSSLLGKALLYSGMPGSIYGGAAKHVTLNSSTMLQVHLSQLCGWMAGWVGGGGSTPTNQKHGPACQNGSNMHVCAEKSCSFKGKSQQLAGAGAALVELKCNDKTGRTGAG